MAVQHQRAPRERSSIAQMHLTAPTDAERVVYADCILTRRKRHHMVTDSAGNVLFRSRWWSDIIEWLEATGVSSYEVQTDRRRYAVTVGRASQAQE